MIAGNSAFVTGSNTFRVETVTKLTALSCYKITDRVSLLPQIITNGQQWKNKQDLRLTFALVLLVVPHLQSLCIYDHSFTMSEQS